MVDTYQDVIVFMEAADQTETGFGNQSDLYIRLIIEEYNELLKDQFFASMHNARLFLLYFALHFFLTII